MGRYDKNKTSASIDFKFINPHTDKEEEYDYSLDDEDIIEVMKLYADYYGVTLDGKDNGIFNLFSSLDSGRYHYINEIFEKMFENDFVQEKISEKLIDKAKAEFEEEKEEEYESEND